MICQNQVQGFGPPRGACTRGAAAPSLTLTPTACSCFGLGSYPSAQAASAGGGELHAVCDDMAGREPTGKV